MSNYKSYYLKSLGLHEDHIPDEEEDKDKQSPFNPDELEQGKEAEADAEDPALADKIAKDNLSDDPEYYSRLKKAGLEDNPTIPALPKMGPLLPQMSPTAKAPQVLAIGILGTKNGLLPAGGIVGDPEKARLGGLELVKNLKPNSQGAIADTPVPTDMAAKGGHFTPDNPEITGNEEPVTNVKGNDSIHPMQVQQLGNPPFNDDGTTHDGTTSPPAAVAGIEGGKSPTPEDKPSTADLEKAIGSDEEDTIGECGPWGVPMGDEEKPVEEPEDLEIDIKEVSAPSAEDFFQHWTSIRQKKDADERRHRDYSDLMRNRPKSMDATEASKEFKRDIAAHKYDDVFTPAQKKTLSILLKQGYRPYEPEPAHPDDPGNESLDKVKIHVYKPSLKSLIFRGESIGDTVSIEVDGTVDGMPVEDFLRAPPPEKNSMRERFQKLANVKPACSTCGTGLPDPNLTECPTCGCQRPNTTHDMKEAGLTSELRQAVDRMKAKGKSSPLMEKAIKYLEKHGK